MSQAVSRAGAGHRHFCRQALVKSSSVLVGCAQWDVALCGRRLRSVLARTFCPEASGGFLGKDPGLGTLHPRPWGWRGGGCREAVCCSCGAEEWVFSQIGGREDPSRQGSRTSQLSSRRRWELCVPPKPLRPVAVVCWALLGTAADSGPPPPPPHPGRWFSLAPSAAGREAGSVPTAWLLPRWACLGPSDLCRLLPAPTAVPSQGQSGKPACPRGSWQLGRWVTRESRFPPCQCFGGWWPHSWEEARAAAGSTTVGAQPLAGQAGLALATQPPGFPPFSFSF